MGLEKYNMTLFDENNDFAVSGTDTGDILFYDVSAGRLGVNSSAPDAAIHVVTRTCFDAQALTPAQQFPAEEMERSSNFKEPTKSPLSSTAHLSFGCLPSICKFREKYNLSGA